MQLLTHKSDLTEDQKLLFQQGASLLYTQNQLQLAVWTTHTPNHQNIPSITIGACSLNAENAIPFLQKCITSIQQQFPNRPIIGPMNGNTWMKHRLILKTSPQKPFLMEPIEPTQLLQTFQQAGFKTLSTYTSSSIDLTTPQPDFDRLAKIIEKQQINIRTIDPQNFEQDLTEIHQLSLTAFSNNFLYTPLPKEAFIRSYLTAKEAIDPDLVLLAYKDNTLIGFLFCIPDLTPHTLIVKTLATSPAHRTAGLGTHLVAIAQQKAKNKGYTEAIHALQYQSNSSLRISHRFSAKIFRTYALMIKK